MKSTLLSRRDLDFLLYEWLGVEELTKRERFADHSRETFDGVLELARNSPSATSRRTTRPATPTSRRSTAPASR